MNIEPENEIFNDTETNCYEIIQLRRVIKYIVDDIYTGTYDINELEQAVPLLMGLSELVNGLQTTY